MTNYTTGADLVDDVLFRGGEPTDSSSDYYSATIRYLNRAWQGLWQGGAEIVPGMNETWWWLQKQGSGILTLLPVFNTGTVQVTNNSTTITFSAAPTRNGANISVEGWHFKVDTHPDVFKISAHTSGNTGATLDSVYTGTDSTAASLACFKLDYLLASDVLKLSAPMRACQSTFGGTRDISLVSPDALRAAWPLETVSGGVPEQFTVLANDMTTGYMQVRFSHFGGTSDTSLIRIDYDYTFRPSAIADDTTEPSMPQEWRKVLCDWALFYLLSDKEDARASDAFNLAKQGLLAMATENRRRQSRSGRSFGKLFPRQTALRRSRGPLRTDSGQIIG